MTSFPWRTPQAAMPELDWRLIYQRLITITCWAIALTFTAGRLARLGFELARPHLAVAFARLGQQLRPVPAPEILVPAQAPKRPRRAGRSQ